MPSFPVLRKTADMDLSWNHNESWLISDWETHVTQHEWAASWFQSHCSSACGYCPVLSGIKDSYCLCCSCAWGPRQGKEISQAIIAVPQDSSHNITKTTNHLIEQASDYFLHSTIVSFFFLLKFQSQQIDIN